MRIENNNLPDRFQQHRQFGETFYMYEFFGHNGCHVGNLKKAVAKVEGVRVVQSETQRGWSNSRALLHFKDVETLEAKLKEVWKYYNEASQEMTEARMAKKDQPKVEKPAPTPRVRKAEKPDKVFDCFVIQDQMKAFALASDMMYKYQEYPVVRITAKSYQKAREQYEKMMEKQNGGRFFGALWVTSKEVK